MALDDPYPADSGLASPDDVASAGKIAGSIGTSGRARNGVSALIGSTGFVGTNLRRSTTFTGSYNSSNIADIAGERLDLVVCAAAPATMWAANADPQRDLDNITSLLESLKSADIDRLVLISTIAVLDDAAAGYDESSARYETAKAYGRNRRLLEEEAQGAAADVHVLRLPALFGEGLKKNFLFDVLNPVPSFLKTDKFEALLGDFDNENATLMRQFFVLDETLGMMKFIRDCPADVSARLTVAFEQAGFTARNFTNSESRFQYYGLDRLWGDIERCIDLDVDVLNVAAEPLRAADVYHALTGGEFVNPTPPLYREDMHSRHAALWDGSGPYLYSADETLAAIKAFAGRQSGHA